MALSKTHATNLLLALGRKHPEMSNEELIQQWEKEVPYALLPDAIRCFSFGEAVPNNRVVSHFEVNIFNGEASGIRYGSREDIKRLDEGVIASWYPVYEGDYQQVAIGDDTSIEAFERFNDGTDPVVYRGVKIHLLQDCEYDKYIREVIDCSHRRENGEFYFNSGIGAAKTVRPRITKLEANLYRMAEEFGFEVDYKFFAEKIEPALRSWCGVYDAKTVRPLITQIEEIEFRVLCRMVAEERGIEVDYKFFEDHVKPALERCYCPKMAESTWKYISFNDDEIPQHISVEQARNINNKMVEAILPLM